MENSGRLLELLALSENIMKSKSNSGLLRLKVLYFAKVYENLSVSMIIDKLGIKKSNFALMTADLVNEGVIELCPTEIDRRCRTIKLTEKGREELNNYLAEVEKSLLPCNLEVEHALRVLTEYLNKIV